MKLTRIKSIKQLNLLQTKLIINVTAFSMQFICKHYFSIFISFNKKLIKRMKADSIGETEQDHLNKQMIHT